jgi:hypothetical protein
MITDRYRDLVNAIKARNGLPPLFPGPAAAKPAPDIVDADEGQDGLELKDADEALERLQEAIEAVNGEMGQPGDDDEAADDNNGAGRKRDDARHFAKVDAMTQLGELALPARKLMVAHFKAKLAEDTGADDKHAKAVSDTAAFILQCHRKARGNAA